MKYNCELIQDLMPLCIDCMASGESRTAVIEHMAECPKCEAVYKQMKQADTFPEGVEETTDVDDYRKLVHAEHVGEEIADYAAVARRLRKRRLRNSILLALFIFGMFLFAGVCLNFAAGYRFTPEAAAGLERKLNPESVLLGEYDWESRKFYFYDCKNYYIITGVRSTWHGWANESYYFVWEKKVKPDAMEITGSLCYWAEDRNRTLQLLALRCHDETVAYIEVSFFGKTEMRERNDDAAIIFAVEAVNGDEALINTPMGTAYDADGNPLYYLTETEDMNWEWVEAGLQ